LPSMESGHRRAGWRRESRAHQPHSGPQRPDAEQTLLDVSPGADHSHLTGANSQGDVDNASGDTGAVFGYYGNISQLQDSTLSRTSLSFPTQYGPDSPRQQRRHQQHQTQMEPQPPQDPQYGSRLTFDVAHEPVPGPAYGASSLYPQQRQSAAIEVLSTQFASAPSFYMPFEPASVQTPGSSQQTPTQFSSASYLHGESSRGSSSSQTFATRSITGPPHPAPGLVAGESGTEGKGTNHDDAYEHYQVTLKRTFQCVHDGQLPDAGQLLLDMSGWLLTNAVELGKRRLRTMASRHVSDALAECPLQA
jgi:hypothetical protein